jgi:hypothetical protein
MDEIKEEVTIDKPPSINKVFLIKAIDHLELIVNI